MRKRNEVLHIAQVIAVLNSNVIIVGAGIAGLTCAFALREIGHNGPVTVLSDEADFPYDRPPLSKATNTDPSPLFSEKELENNAINLRLGVTARKIDRQNRSLELSEGSTCRYDFLVIATGARARVLHEAHYHSKRILTLRNLNDATRLRGELLKGRSVAIIGGGWLGLELGATSHQLGLDVAIFERANRLCERVIPSAISTYLKKLHVDNGVNISTNVDVQIWDQGDSLNVAWNGETRTFDLAIVAAGSVPNDKIGVEAGLISKNGILTDRLTRTDDPYIYAIGDVASSFNTAEGSHLRLESWKHAVAQGRRAAESITGSATTPMEAPWFWSEQFGQLIQIAGLPKPNMKLLSEDLGPNPLWKFGLNDIPSMVIGVNRTRDVRKFHRELYEQALP